MAAGGNRDDSARTAVTDGPSFALERFAWAAPDRLEVSGVFSSLGDESVGDARLVVHGSTGEHSLPAVSDGVDRSWSDGSRWQAAFVWREAPVAFETARLEFDNGYVELPQPGTRRLRRRTVLE